MLSVEQTGIKYHFLIFGMTLPVIEPLVSQTIDEHFDHFAKRLPKSYLPIQEWFLLFI